MTISKFCRLNFSLSSILVNAACLFLLCQPLNVKAQHTTCGIDDSESFREIQTRGYNSNQTYWESQIIPYHFEAYLSSSTESAFLKVIAELHSSTNLCFIPKAKEAKDFSVGPSSTRGVAFGSSRGVQVNSGSLRTMRHEIGHGLGLKHEHQRPDRDTYITVLKENIEPEYLYAFDILKMQSNYAITEDYDYGSVMHYRASSFSINGEPTIITNNDADIGSLDYSQTDIDFLNELYPKKIDCDSAAYHRKPIAKIGFKELKIDCESKEITVESQSIGNVKSIAWEVVGEVSSKSTEDNPTFLLPTAGEYMIILTVSGDYGTHASSKYFKINKCEFEKTMYPNPTSSTAFIDLSINPKAATFRITSSSGKLLWEKRYYSKLGLSDPIELDFVETLPSGLYYITTTTRGQSYTEKLEVIR